MAATAALATLQSAVLPQSAPGPPHLTASPRSTPPSPPGDQGRARHSVADLERRRLARELHDRVIQQVLAAGLTIDWCMGEVPAGSPLHEQLAVAKRLTRNAARELRSSLQELAQRTDGDDEDLPDMLRRLLDTRATPRMRLSLQIRGRPVPLPPAGRRRVPVQLRSSCRRQARGHPAALCRRRGLLVRRRRRPWQAGDAPENHRRRGAGDGRRLSLRVGRHRLPGTRDGLDAAREAGRPGRHRGGGAAAGRASP